MSLGTDLPNFRPIRGSTAQEHDLCATFVRSKADECESLARKGVDPEGLHLMAHRLTAMADTLGAGLHR